MIKFPNNDSITKFMEFKLGKKRLKKLEKSLRLLGHFNSNEDLIITNEECISASNDTLYEIKDLDETSFKFYNYGSDNNSDSIDRYKKNYLVFMKRKNQQTEYTYRFFSRELKVIELQCILSEKRKIKVKIEQKALKIILEEQNERYIIHLPNDYANNNIYILKKFEEMVEKARNIEVLNLENSLGIIDNRKKVSSCSIYNQDVKLASIDFINGEISKYEYQFNNAYAKTSKSLNLYWTSPIGWDKYKIKRARNYQVKVIINDNIVRTVETEDAEKNTCITKLTLEHNNEDIQSEIKMLMKII